MKSTGIVRRMDDLGRVVIPKEIRRTLRIKEGDPLELYTDKDNLILKKYSPITTIESYSESLCKSLSIALDASVLICDTDTFLSSNGVATKEFLQRNISNDLSNVLNGKKLAVFSQSNNGNLIDLCLGIKLAFSHALIVPIVSDLTSIGGIILLKSGIDNIITPLDIKLTQFSAEIIAGQFN